MLILEDSITLNEEREKMKFRANFFQVTKVERLFWFCGEKDRDKKEIRRDKKEERSSSKKEHKSNQT